MMERTWGYADQVGQWCGAVNVPDELLWQSPAATCYTLEQFIPLLAEIHRPTTVDITWVEYNQEGQELVGHELEEVAVADWDELRSHLERVSTATAHRVEVRALFIELDTLVTESSGDSWVERSATFQISISPPGLDLFSVGVCYTTYIDVWLSVTYGEHYKPRSNRQIAERNRPRLETFLRWFATLVGDSFRTDLSKLYYFAITPTGFREIELDDLPTRGTT